MAIPIIKPINMQHAEKMGKQSFGTVTEPESNPKKGFGLVPLMAAVVASYFLFKKGR